jgi:hypothetical protein
MSESSSYYSESEDESATESDLAFIVQEESSVDEATDGDEPSLIDDSVLEEVTLNNLKPEERAIYINNQTMNAAGLRRSSRITAGQAPSVYRDPDYLKLITDNGKDSLGAGSSSDLESEDSDWEPAEGASFEYDD